MNNKDTWLLAILLIILTVLIILVGRSWRRPAFPAPAVFNPAPTATVTPYVSVANPDQFRTAVPASITVPKVGQILPAVQQKDVAVPTTVVPAAAGATTQFRIFNISASAGRFTPSKIIANLGDTIHINFTAVDGDYDITFPSYNMKQSAKQGETKILEFQALADGSFLYYCGSCGGPTGTATGSIIIVKS
jgi:plastocyanin